jgi:hypothetical protein
MSMAGEAQARRARRQAIEAADTRKYPMHKCDNEAAA